MRKIDGNLIFSPTDLSQFFKSPFVSWMEHFCIDNPSEKFELPEDPTMKLLAKKGDEHERKYFEKLKKNSKNTIEIKRSEKLSDAIRDTILAMKSGADVIYQGALRLDNFVGYSDFLVKVNTPSKLGNFSYEIYDTKLAIHSKPEYIIQLSCYTEMLATIQGFLPDKFHIVLGNENQDSYKVTDFSEYYKHFKKRFLELHNSFNSKMRPDPQSWEDFGKWNDFANEILLEKDHLSQVAGISIGQIKKLETKGITKLVELAKAKESSRPKGMPEETFKKLINQAALQVATKNEGTTQFELRTIDSNQAHGLQRLPPADKGDVYFDMEGYPLEVGGLEYLFGAVIEENEKPKFKDWWAVNKSQEREAFESWIDWVHKRYRANPNMHIYHYAPYETTAMKKLMCMYMTREHEVDDLLRNGVFIDLYQIVREGLVVGESSYSIKKLESLYNFKRKGDVKTAGDSVVQFANWLEIQDGNSWKTSTVLSEIRYYNEEDCISTLELTKWLRLLQKKEKIKYIHPEIENANPVETERSEADQLLQKMLNKPPEGKKESEVHEILAAALGYHRREAKPQWWSFFSRHAALPEDLVEDFDCLAKCEVKKKTTTGVVAKFNPEQETKMSLDSNFVLHNADGSGVIESIDYESGTVQVKLKLKSEIDKEITLLPPMPISTKPLEKSIYETAETWHAKRDLNCIRPALKALLCREEPKIRGRKKGQAVVSENPERLLAEVVDAAKNLQESILAIQGPPGTGKTYTASHMIVELLKNGSKVGVTSNGHKAINLLLLRVSEILSNDKNFARFKIAKVRSEIEGDISQSKRIAQFSSAKDYWKKGANYDLVGGTSWFFAADDSKEKFDYLFIEEAGQFSLANTIAVQRAAKNLILLGDQMQLEQPVQGTHPDCIAHSVLNFYLNGHDTVPSNLGIFLGVSRRMRSDVCNFISTSFYEGRLLAHSTTADNKVILSDRTKLKENSGVLFIPVAHEGNSQGSEEEVEEIKRIVNELLMAKVTEYGESQRNLELDDILFVAPYNLQVGLIKSHLGDNSRVGSVDLFQGQEAPVVVLSLCSSDGSSSPRGLEFILNRNRLNVAISRAKTLAIVVASPEIANTRISTISQMQLLNLFVKIIEGGSN